MIEKQKLAKDMRNYLSRNERIYWGVAGEHVESQLYLFFSFYECLNGGTLITLNT